MKKYLVSNIEWVSQNPNLPYQVTVSLVDNTPEDMVEMEVKRDLEKKIGDCETFSFQEIDYKMSVDLLREDLTKKLIQLGFPLDICVKLGEETITLGIDDGAGSFLWASNVTCYVLQMNWSTMELERGEEVNHGTSGSYGKYNRGSIGRGEILAAISKNWDIAFDLMELAIIKYVTIREARRKVLDEENN
jgi:hypothetical protein